MFSKILASLKKGFYETFENKYYILARVFWIILISYIFFEVWNKILKSKDYYIFQYIVLAQGLRISFRSLDYYIELEYKEGKFDLRFLRPLPIFLQYFLENFGVSVFNFLFLIISINILLFVFRIPTINIIKTIPTFLLFFLSYFFFFYFVGILVVFLEEVRPISWVIKKINMLTQLIPKEYFGFGNIYEFLPGYFIYYLNVKLYFDLNLIYLIKSLSFISIFFVISLIFEKLVKRKIEVYGG